MSNTLRENAHALAVIRGHVADAESEIEGLQQALEKTQAWIDLKNAKETLAKLGEAEQMAYDNLAEVMIAETESSGEKNFSCGKVVEKTEYEIDQDKALNWAIEKKLPALLKLNITELKKVTSTLSPSGVKVSKVLATRINKDLSKFTQLETERQD